MRNTILALKQELISQFGEGLVKTDHPLASYTTLKVGGNADLFVEVETRDDLVKAVSLAYTHKLPVFILGGGSNVLISDSGVRGLTIRNRCRQIRIVKIQGKIAKGEKAVKNVLVEADTGVLINQLVRFTASQGLSGLEHHLGLPGTVGGALYMNSKWTHPEVYIGDVLLNAHILEPNGEIKIVPASYFDFAYDQSILQKTHEVVLWAAFNLESKTKEQVWETAQSSLSYRNETQPTGVATAGCTFRNISSADAASIPTPNNTKSAGYLIDQTGLKGFKHGNAAFSDRHANFILTQPGATASDVYTLIQEAQKRVWEKFKVRIIPEVVLTGDFV